MGRREGRDGRGCLIEEHYLERSGRVGERVMDTQRMIQVQLSGQRFQTFLLCGCIYNMFLQYGCVHWSARVMFHENIDCEISTEK